MSKLKPITEYTPEELLELVEKNTTNEEKFNYEYPNDVLEFLSIYQIKEGPNQILLPLIFNLYKKWSKKPIHRNQFGMEMSKFFTSVKYGMGTTYRINKSKEFFIDKTIIKKRNKTKGKQWNKHFKSFISKFNIETGRFYVKDIVLYNIYDKWTYKNGNKNPLSFTQFLKFCRLYFKINKMIKGSEWFSLSENLKELITPDLINLMKQK